jgi:hypothetical protein
MSSQNRRTPRLVDVGHARVVAVRGAESLGALPGRVIRELYFRGDRPSAVLVLECRDVEEVRQILDTLPLVAAGLIGFEIHRLVPYPGFARLFAKH